jgi:hypothetical protein
MHSFRKSWLNHHSRWCTCSPTQALSHIYTGCSILQSSNTRILCLPSSFSPPLPVRIAVCAAGSRHTRGTHWQKKKEKEKFSQVSVLVHLPEATVEKVPTGCRVIAHTHRHTHRHTERRERGRGRGRERERERERERKDSLGVEW